MYIYIYIYSIITYCAANLARLLRTIVASLTRSLCNNADMSRLVCTTYNVINLTLIDIYDVRRLNTSDNNVKTALLRARCMSY